MRVQAIADVLGGAAVLGGSVTSASRLHREIGRGFPVGALERVAARVHPDGEARRALMRHLVPIGLLERRLRGGRLSPAESECTARLAGVIAHAEHVSRDRGDARQFLVAPHPEFDDRPPIEVPVEEFGARRVEEIPDGILQGLPA